MFPYEGTNRLEAVGLLIAVIQSAGMAQSVGSQAAEEVLLSVCLNLEVIPYRQRNFEPVELANEICLDLFKLLWRCQLFDGKSLGVREGHWCCWFLHRAKSLPRVSYERQSERFGWGLRLRGTRCAHITLLLPYWCRCAHTDTRLFRQSPSLNNGRAYSPGEYVGASSASANTPN